VRIGIYGGTFNPPHIGHVRSAKAAVRQLGLETLVVVPAGVPPHKPLPKDTPAGEARLKMTRAAFAEIECAEVSDIEVYNPEVSYTVDTIAAVKAKYPGAELFLLVGTDMYLSLELWRDIETIFKSVTPAVFSRGSDDIIKVTGYSRSIQKRYGVDTETVINNVIEISSSRLRRMLPGREGREYIADINYSFIIKNRLYGAKPDWDWLRAKAHEMLSPQRIAHVDGCEEEALRLARRWSVNQSDAREAAILHDITKKLSFDEHMKIAGEYGITVGKLENGEEKLLHSLTGAALARAEFGVSEAVAGAIRWHTTGRARMTELEKVIYLADYIEPTRDFKGVDILRALAYESLDEATKMGLEISVKDMKDRGIIPNRITYDAMNDLLI
jgi:nicotinate-nucleotide adenylyltransferase